jgi:hypothetical protein
MPDFCKYLLLTFWLGCFSLHLYWVRYGYSQGRIQDLGGVHLKKIAPSGGRRENFTGISCEKSRFYAKQIIFFPIWRGVGVAPGAPSLDPPLISLRISLGFGVCWRLLSIFNNFVNYIVTTKFMVGIIIINLLNTLLLVY